MGWWWSSDSTKAAPPNVPSIDSISPPDAPASLPPSAPPSSSVPPPRSLSSPAAELPRRKNEQQTLTRDEESDAELVAWLKEIQAESEEANRQRPLTSKNRREQASSPDDISPDTLYPTSISCRSAFDYAFFCQSFGGQFVNVYRYGSFRSCSNHWQDFWLCMRTRGWEEEERKKAIRDHYRKKAVKYKQGPSSEDIWEVRTDPIRDAFQGDLEALEKQVDEWRKANPGAKNPWEDS